MIPLSIQQMAEGARKKKRRVKFVPTPELAPEDCANPDECGVHVLEMTLEEKDDFEKQMAKAGAKKDGVDNYRARVIARTLATPEGERACQDAHWELFKGFPAGVMTRIFNAGWKLNGYDQADLEEMAETLKNAPTTSAASA